MIEIVIAQPSNHSDNSPVSRLDDYDLSLVRTECGPTAYWPSYFICILVTKLTEMIHVIQL